MAGVTTHDGNSFAKAKNFHYHDGTGWVKSKAVHHHDGEQ